MDGGSEGTESMAGRKSSFYREMIKYIQISILAVLMALLVGGRVVGGGRLFCAREKRGGSGGCRDGFPGKCGH